jgi:hypothetical protein
MKSKGPAGVTLITILFFVLGLLSLIWGVLVFGVGGLSSMIGGFFGAENLLSFGNSTAWSGFVSLITAGLQIVVGFGLLGMKKWAWYLATIGVALNVLLGLVQIFTGGLYGIMCGSIAIIIPIIILVYLLTPSIRQAFNVKFGQR